MTSTYVSFAHGSGDPGRKLSVEEEVKDVKSYLNNNTSGHTFYFWDFGDAGINAGSYGDGSSGEKQFIKDVLDKFDNEGLLTDWENVVIAHGIWGWGYGRSLYYETQNGTPAYGCTVYAGKDWVGDWEVRGFTWHEAAHSFNAHHNDGHYALSSDEMYSITPMCMGYLHDEDGVVDTTWEAGSGPSTFCGRSNYDHTYLYSSKSSNHDLDDYSSCTLNAVQGWIDGNRP